MADAAEDLELEPLVEEPEIEEAEPPETPEAETPEGDEDELVVSFDGEGDAPPHSEERDSDLVNRLRRELRERDRRLKVFEDQKRAPKIEVGEKPTIEGCEYDTDRFEREFEAWTQRKAEAARQEAEQRKSQQVQVDAWNARVATVSEQIAALKAKDFPHALEEVKSAFSEAQQVVIMRAPKNSAQVIYALGKHPAKAAELAKIVDPIELAAELARLEGKLTVTAQKKPPPPEQIVRGSAPLSAQTDKHLERLEKDAERTGDRTKVVAYKRQLKAQGR